MGKKRMTKEEYTFLSDWEDRLITAAKADYARAIQKPVAERMKEIYERLTDDKTIHLDCSKCVLRMLKSLYKFYSEKKSKDVEQLEPPVSDNLE